MKDGWCFMDPVVNVGLEAKVVVAIFFRDLNQALPLPVCILFFVSWVFEVHVMPELSEFSIGNCCRAWVNRCPKFPTGRWKWGVHPQSERFSCSQYASNERSRGNPWLFFRKWATYIIHGGFPNDLPIIHWNSWWIFQRQERHEYLDPGGLGLSAYQGSIFFSETDSTDIRYMIWTDGLGLEHEWTWLYNSIIKATILSYRVLFLCACLTLLFQKTVSEFSQKS